VPFLTGPPLAFEETDRYGRFEESEEHRTLFEHCERALERGVTRGPHQLPLVGAGDWNDGMNRVGARGRGESVWLGWFCASVMRDFAELCARRGEAQLGESWRRRARELADTLEAVGWDGEWYLRAIDDDGLPWGAAACDECRIDSIAQSWSVLSGAGAPERARRALRAAERELVPEAAGVARLLWPPFDATPRDPGYIRAYPPGVRENGGQYTHAAAWLAFAFAATGDGERAARLLRLANPIARARSLEDARRYRVEPYVLAADVGARAPHLGRGGWTWYTGSAAWTWRTAVEAILGLRREGGLLRLAPCLPRHWGGYRATLRCEAGILDLEVEDPDRVGAGEVELELDGVPQAEPLLALPGDGKRHAARVRLRRAGRPPEPG
jgi:cyclic beta-1,2-glucan synthetase